MSEFTKIPTVGKKTEETLFEMGYCSLEDLKGKTADELYIQECNMKGKVVDRCQLYMYRLIEYYVNTPNPDSAKLKWWYFKD